MAHRAIAPLAPSIPSEMTPHAAASPVDPCPSPDTVVRFIDGNLDEDGRDALDRHLDACARCFELISALADDDDGDERSAPRSVLSAGTAVGHYSIDACIGAGCRLWRHRRLLRR